jgi:hypothetical protein
VAERLKDKIVQGSKACFQRSPKTRRKQTTRDADLRFLEGKKYETRLVIDGSAVKDRFLVLVNGSKVNLPAKSFKYLVKLTWALFQNEDGWIHKSDFEPGENQARYLYRLKNQIKPSLAAGQTIFENNRLGSYRLTIPKQSVELNKNALLKNPDAEIEKMAEELVSE